MAHIITSTSATLIFNGKVYTVNASDRYFKKFCQFIDNSDPAGAIAYYSRKKDYAKNLPAPFSVREGKLYHDEDTTAQAISKRVIKMLKAGIDTKYMLRFLDNLYQNPSKRAVDELYGFLESNELPITANGGFMAYKRIKSDWTDCRTGTLDNSIGQRVWMARNKVDEDKDRTCSAGLHVASLGYLKHFTGDILIAVEINPRDVVSVPTDYDNSKMRVCEYTVIEQLDIAIVKGDKDAWDIPVYGDLDDEDEDELGNWCHP